MHENMIGVGIALGANTIIPIGIILQKYAIGRAQGARAQRPSNRSLVSCSTALTRPVRVLGPSLVWLQRACLRGPLCATRSGGSAWPA